MERFDSLGSALDVYLARRNSQHAVMINGSWGAGKTHYILNALIPNHKDCAFHYFSLYGLKSTGEIYEKIDQNLKTDSKDSDVKDVVCLDDLERWHGDIDSCISYVNQLVEHRNCKCILIGNLEELTEENVISFSKAQEKTVRHIYQFNPPVVEILYVAMNLVEYRSLASRQFIRSLIKANADTLHHFLDKVSMRNIRIITEALQLFDVVYRHHSSVLKASRGLAFTYFMSLISVIILIKRSFLESGDRKKLLEGQHESNKGFKFLSEIGYFDKELPVALTQESRILLDTIFYRLDKISLRGIFSIVKNGYYLKEDFEGEFELWVDEHHYEEYLDREYYYELENGAAFEIFNRALDSFIKQREVNNPVTLLLLAERVVEDIANGAIDYDPVKFKKQFVETIDSLYESGEMEVVDLKLFDLAGERFRNCTSIYNYVIKRNNDCQLTHSKNEIASFWERIIENPELSESLITKLAPTLVLAESFNTAEVIKSLESINNGQLNRLVNWVNEGLEKTGYPEEAKAASNLNSLSTSLTGKYGKSIGIRANHFRRLAQILNVNKMIDKDLGVA